MSVPSPPLMVSVVASATVIVSSPAPPVTETSLPVCPDTSMVSSPAPPVTVRSVAPMLSAPVVTSRSPVIALALMLVRLSVSPVASAARVKSPEPVMVKEVAAAASRSILFVLAEASVSVSMPATVRATAPVTPAKVMDAESEEPVTPE